MCVLPSNTPSTRRQPADQHLVRGGPVRRVQVTPYCVRWPHASCLGLGFLVRSSSASADLKLRVKRKQASLGHLERNAEAETTCRTESLRPGCFHGLQTCRLRNRALGHQRAGRAVRGHQGPGPNPLSATNQLCDLGQIELTLWTLLDSNTEGHGDSGANLPDLNPTSATPELKVTYPLCTSVCLAGKWG